MLLIVLGLLALYFPEYSDADIVYVWNGDGVVSKFDANGVRYDFPTNLAGWNGPVGLAADNYGNLMAGCPANSTVWKFSTNGGISQVGMVDSISALAFDQSERLFGTIPNYNEVVRMGYVPGNGGWIEIADYSQSLLAYPVSLAFNASGSIYVVNNFPPPWGGWWSEHTNSLKKFSSGLAHVETVASKLDGPWGVACDKFGNVFVSLTSGDSILKFATNGSVSEFANYFTAGIHAPKGVAFDSLGNLFVANSGDGTIRKLDSAGQGSVFATNLTTPTSIAAYPGLKLWQVPIRINVPQILPDGGVRLDFITNPYGTNIVMSASTPFAASNDWLVLGEAVEVAPGVYHFVDSAATNHPVRYYRVRSQ